MDHLDPEQQDDVLARQQRADVLWRLQRALEQEPRAGAARWLRAAILAVVVVVGLSSFVPAYIACCAAVYVVVLDIAQILVGETRLAEATSDAVELGDIRALELLLKAHAVGRANTRNFAGSGLRQILPQVTPDDRAWITRSMVRNIDSLLSRFEPDLIEAALIALEQVGDPQSLERVRSLLGMGRLNSTPDGSSNQVASARWVRSFPRLGQLAHRVAENLEQRIEEEREQAVLLRPAQAEDEHLLRPSVSTPANPPEELLRPATLHPETSRNEE